MRDSTKDGVQEACGASQSVPNSFLCDFLVCFLLFVLKSRLVWNSLCNPSWSWTFVPHCSWPLSAGITCVQHWACLCPLLDNAPRMILMRKPGWVVDAWDLSALVSASWASIRILKYEVNHKWIKQQSQGTVLSPNTQIHRWRERIVMVPCVSVSPVALRWFKTAQERHLPFQNLF